MQIEATLVADYERFHSGGPGTIRFDKDGNGQIARMPFKCPCGCGDVFGVSLKPAVANGWEWNGSQECPTLSPSVLCYDSKADRRVEHWHGYLRNGIWESC